MDTEEVAEASEASTVPEASEASEASEATTMAEPSASLESATTNGVSFSGKLQAYDDDQSLRVHGALYGLKPHKDVRIKLTAKAIAEARCTNPAGHQPPGRNPVFRQINVSGQASLSAWQIKFGFLTFVVKSLNPPKEILGAPDCPNPRWKETIVGVKFTSFKLTIEQPKNFQVSGQSCTCGSPTLNGPVTQSNMTCN